MEAKELRIGNLVNIIDRSGEVHLPSGIVYIVHEIGLGDVSLLMSGLNLWSNDLFKVSHFDLSTIPLTEEWLIKLGFIKMPVNGYDYLLKISAATLQCRCNGDKWYFQFNETYFGEMFPYVHQVQNFCASLGKELTSA